MDVSDGGPTGDDAVEQPDTQSKRPPNHMSHTFYDRIARGNNLTKMGNSSNPRDVAMLIAAQARAPVDCPTLQAIGPQATNQAVKAIAIARTFLKESQSIDICVQPEFFQLEDGHTGLLLLIRKKTRRARSGEDEAQALKAASGTDAKVLAGVINSSSGRCWSSDTYNPVPGVMPGVPSSRGYSGGFGSALMAKDLGLALGQPGWALQPRHPLPGRLDHGGEDLLAVLLHPSRLGMAIDLVARLKAKRPDIAIGADIIAGFPTEDDAMFANSVDLIRQCGIVHGHIFPYSPKKGTPAARMPQLPPQIIKARAKALRETVAVHRAEWMNSLVGTVQNVAVESGGLAGHAENFAYLKLDRIMAEGSIVAARVTNTQDGNLQAEVIE
jgi:stage V sporulation protein SpoVS